MSGYETACVECGETLPPYARSCRCGWKAAVKPKPAASTNCACGRFGITKRGGAWLCGICAGVPPRAVASAAQPNTDRNLNSVWRQRCLAAAGVIRTQREPGEDEDYQF